MDEQDSRVASQAAKKKKKGKIIDAGEGLEGFMDWVDPNASDSAKDMEDDMSSFAVGFSTQMCKRAMSAQGENTPDSEVSGEKCLKRSGLDEEAQRRKIILLWTPQNEPPMPYWH